MFVNKIIKLVNKRPHAKNNFHLIAILVHFFYFLSPYNFRLIVDALWEAEREICRASYYCDDNGSEYAYILYKLNKEALRIEITKA